MTVASRKTEIESWTRPRILFPESDSLLPRPPEPDSKPRKSTHTEVVSDVSAAPAEGYVALMSPMKKSTVIKCPK